MESNINKKLENYACKIFDLDKKKLRKQGYDLKKVGHWKIEKHSSLDGHYAVNLVNEVYRVGLGINCLGIIYYENGEAKSYNQFIFG